MPLLLTVLTQGRPSLAYSAWPTDEPSMRKKMSRYFGPRFLEKSPLMVDMMVKNMLKARKQNEEGGSGAQEGESPAERGSRLQFDASSGFDGTALLPEILVPTLVATGTDDLIIPKENAYFLQSRLARATLKEYAEAGHLLLAEEPEAFVLDVASFLG